MKYYSNYWMSWTWNKLIQMVKENYETEENKDDVICFGSYFFAPASELKRRWEEECGRKFRKIIVYQSEPLVNNHNFKPDHMINNIRSADEIWEYDLENAFRLQSMGFENVKYKPPLMSNSLGHIQNVENPDIDLLFYGSFSSHRAMTLRNLHDGYVMNSDDDLHIFQNMNFVWTWNLKESELDKYIARSKIILNMHPYDGESRQQATRIFYALCNNKQVLSQAGKINYFGDSIYEFQNVQEFGDRLVGLLKNDNWRNKPKNYNKHFLNKSTRSNVAIFYHLNDPNRYGEQIFKLQVKQLFDTADYIHVNSQQHLPLYFSKINRLTTDSSIEQHINSFTLFNPDYKIIRVTDSDIIGV